MKKIVLAMGLLLVAALVGCNTVQGVGKDMQQGGEAIQKAAN